ncbi:diguanylate cyclase (GGDEF)-like protein [Azomonas agilis]|uniref:Diguanylate cyclase DosC n=1 Tax=Azomonas agilis TaxID=116849 RepID=A0A562J1X8_9GAMM|nr:diguanylate cyclase [Azomonas agilis]TWH77110.1 diguanylate cyclase (GGDEF)-like protein [Azomonas agilis]
MKQTDQTLLEQMRITDFEVEHRKNLFLFSSVDAQLLKSCKSLIEQNIDAVVSEFYRMQTSIPEIALLIGDADTLARLRSAQRRYILDLFSGLYDLEYINNRLRIGLVHKRIGVEPKLYLSAIYTLKHLLHETIEKNSQPDMNRIAIISALDKLLLFDVTLVFETYIRSLVSEIETAKDKSEQYARSMEEKVKERTRQLEEISCTDALTGLLNVRHLQDIITTALRSAQRRSEPVSVIYIDIDDFKKINDTQGHQRGDEILRTVGNLIKDTARMEDNCIRYGGDEFCVLLTNCREDQAREQFINRLTQKISERLSGVTISIGVAQTGPNEYLDAHTLIKIADERMYAAKQTHKNNIAKITTLGVDKLIESS